MLGDHYKVGEWVEMMHRSCDGKEEPFRAYVVSVDEELGRVELRTEDGQMLRLVLPN